MFDSSSVILPPQSKEAEEALIGAIIVNPKDLDILGYINEEDFYFSSTKYIWKAIRDLKSQGLEIDFLTVNTQLDKNGDLEGIGGPAGLAALINAATGFNTQSYAKIVKDLAQRRNLLEQATQLAKIAYDYETPLGENVTSVVGKVVDSARSNDKSARHISHGLSKLYEFVEMRMQDPRDVWGIPTGFIDIDKFMGGQHKGEVFYLAGEPGVGKTRLALQMTMQAALPENGSHSVAIYSFEMQEIEIVKRMLSDRLHVTTFEMNSGKMGEEKVADFCADIEYMERLPIYICDCPMNPLELRADLLYHKEKEGIEMYMLDYLMLMQGYENMDETPRSGVLSRHNKLIAHDLDLASITVQSVTKEIFGSDSPTNKSMRGSAQVIHDADTIAFMSKCNEAGRQNIVNLDFTKTRTIARSLAVARIELYSDTIYPTFHDATTRTISLEHIV